MQAERPSRLAIACLPIALSAALVAQTPCSTLWAPNGRTNSFDGTALSASAARTTVAIPNTPVAVGVNLLEQVVTLETDLSGAMLAVTSSNGLQLTIGAF